MNNITTMLFLISLVIGWLTDATASAQTNSVPAKPASTSRSLRAYGLAVPKSQVTLRAAVDGHVGDIRFVEGQFVQQGDLVVELECGPAAARVKVAKLESESTGVLENIEAELAVAQSMFQRMEQLFKKDAASEQEFNEAGLRLDRAKAAMKIERERLAASAAKYELALAELEQFRLRAPFDGQVVQVQTNIGSAVSQSNPLIQIVSLDALRVDLFLPVAEATELKINDSIQLQVGAPLAQTITAKVIFRSPVIEAATGTTRVTLEIDNRKLQLPAGFTVSMLDTNSQ